METPLNRERLLTINRYVKSWFMNNDIIDIMNKTYESMSNGSLQLTFCRNSIKFETLDLYKRTNIKNLIHRSFYKSHMVELLRMNVTKQEALDYMLLLFITKLLIESDGSPDQVIINAAEIEYKKKISEVEQVMKAKSEFSKAVNENADTLQKGFRQIYQLTSDDDLRRFDFMYSVEKDKYNQEKVEIGLILMEKGNGFRKDLKGQSKTFKTSYDNKITIYFPKSDDNISDGRYSYPRAAVHTSVSLAKYMMRNRMVSALGLSIGWGGMIDESNFTAFLNKMNVTENTMPGFDRLKNLNYMMYLVTIPRVKPHKYMDLSIADAFIFMLFNMINDTVRNITLQKTNSNIPLKSNFTADAISKLSNLGLMIDNLDKYSKAIAFATKVCITNIKRKYYSGKGEDREK